MVPRSIKGETGSPASFSLSPCMKNSSITRIDHGTHRSAALAGLDTSAQCSAILRIARVFSGLVSAKLPLSVRALNFASSSKWPDMSVPRIIASMTSRTCVASCRSTAASRLCSGAVSTAQACEAWKFSSTARSL